MSTPAGVNRGGAVRGGNSTRGGSRNVNRGGQSSVPIAAQMKQLQRLDEPREMTLFRRFKDLGITQVKSVYGQTGLIDQKLVVPSHNFVQAWGLRPSGSASTELTLLQGEQILANIASDQKMTRALARRGTRLGANYVDTAWQDLSGEEKDILLLSNAEFDRRYPPVTTVKGKENAGAGVFTKEASPTPSVPAKNGRK